MRNLKGPSTGSLFSIVSYSPFFMTFALVSQFHVYLPWGQCPFSIVSQQFLKCKSASRTFQPGEGPSMCLLRDCKTSRNLWQPQIQALVLCEDAAEHQAQAGQQNSHAGLKDGDCCSRSETRLYKQRQKYSSRQISLTSSLYLHDNKQVFKWCSIVNYTIQFFRYHQSDQSTMMMKMYLWKIIIYLFLCMKIL